MSIIEVSTSHNIVVRFELASVIQRITAWFVDIFLLVIFTVIAFAVLKSEALYWLIIFPIWTFYHFFWEVFNKGQSPGKMLMRIRVVTLKGRTPLVLDYFTRWIFRMIDVTFSIGALATIFISSSGQNQRVGDIMAQTAVVRKRNENNISLKSITDLDSEEDDTTHEIKFPGIAAFSDDDMLLLKQTLIRYRQKSSKSNEKVLLTIAESIAEELNVSVKEASSLKFLDKVLYDYIVLTR